MLLCISLCVNMQCMEGVEIAFMLGRNELPSDVVLPLGLLFDDREGNILFAIVYIAMLIDSMFTIIVKRFLAL